MPAKKTESVPPLRQSVIDVFGEEKDKIVTRKLKTKNQVLQCIWMQDNSIQIIHFSDYTERRVEIALRLRTILPPQPKASIFDPTPKNKAQKPEEQVTLDPLRNEKTKIQNFAEELERLLAEVDPDEPPTSQNLPTGFGGVIRPSKKVPVS